MTAESETGTVVREPRRNKVIYRGASEAVYGLGIFGAWFYYIGHATTFYWYVSGCIFVSLAVYALMRDTRDRSAMGR